MDIKPITTGNIDLRKLLKVDDSFYNLDDTQEDDGLQDMPVYPIVYTNTEEQFDDSDTDIEKIIKKREI